MNSTHKAQAMGYNLCLALSLFFFFLFVLQFFTSSTSLFNDWKLQILRTKTLTMDRPSSNATAYDPLTYPNSLVTTQNRAESPEGEPGENTPIQITSLGENLRSFNPFGLGSYLFIHMSSYRGGPNQFFINGLGSKPNHVFSNANFKCQWIPSVRPGHQNPFDSSPMLNTTDGSHNSNGDNVIEGNATKMLPDWGFGRVYTTVVVMCTFDRDVGVDREGGELVLYASPTDSFDDASLVQRIVALREEEGEYIAIAFDPPYPYEYVYCGSPLFGALNPQRIREWVSYHMKLFGPRSHFVLYDAGGIHPGVQKVLEPWVKAKRITIENVRAQEKFDGYYHNQFLIVNDCLHKTRFMTNWTFFFDVDEFLYLPEESSLEMLLAEHSRFTQIFFEQVPMSHQLCMNNIQNANYSKMWGFEKLVFKWAKKGVRRDRKYAIQPRNVLATGVHLSQNLRGKSFQIRGDKSRYYHYHGTTSFPSEVCRHFVNVSLDHFEPIRFENEPFSLDLSMHDLASSIKDFEIEQIGEQ